MTLAINLTNIYIKHKNIWKYEIIQLWKYKNIKICEYGIIKIVM